MPRFSSIPLASLLGVSLAFTAVPASSQQMSNAGIGTVKRFYNASVQTNPFDALITGVAHIGGKEYLCSGSPGGTTTPLVYVFTKGVKTGQFSTPLAPGSGSFDMDTDGTIIFNAADNGILVYDTAGGTANLKAKAKNGLMPITKNPIPVPATILNPHAVAYDRNGNAGKGSLFVSAQAGGPILELALDGTQLASFPNLGWRGGGLTVDSRTGNLWCMTGGAGSYDIIELGSRAVKLKPTGARFMQGNPATQWQLRCCGGICGIPGGDPQTYASDFDIALVNRQPGDDYLFIHRVHLIPSVLGYDEAELVGAVNATTGLSRGFQNLGSLGAIKSNDTLNWALRPGKSGKKNQPAIVTLSAGRDAALDGLNFGGLLLPEWRVLSPFSSPPSASMLFMPASLVGGPVTTVRIPPGILRCFELVRLQAIVVELAPGPNFLATNEIWAHSSDEKSCGILVEALGVNSFNAITTSGFWRITHRGGLPPIQELTLDWMACNDVRQTEIYFDTDQINMADQFNAGNSTALTCTGTYRNGSDGKVGLIYDAKNSPVAACASAGANSGFIGSNGFNNGNGTNYKTLTFRFAGSKFFGTPPAPKVFEFDCDTDRGRGITGAAMEGLVVTIKLLGGKVLKGELRADLSSTVSRSVAGF